MKSHGFTLMELMIVMAIISILAAIAIPSYKHYTQRARFTSVIIACEPFKTAISLALQEGAELQALKNGVEGIPNSPKNDTNIQSIDVNDGIITATAKQNAGGYTYILTPNDDGSEWSISGSCVKAGLCKQ